MTTNKWEFVCKELRESHAIKLASVNAFSVLTNGTIIRTEPELPPEPIENMFIPNGKLFELVREALDYKNDYEEILINDRIKPYHYGY